MSDERRLFEITGSAARDFLQGLVTNDIAKLGDGLVYAALLSPQGKYLADFFLVPLDEGTIGLDISAALAPDLLRRLNMYKLRADVQIAPADLAVSRGLGPVPSRALTDPRHPALGWRAYSAEGVSDTSGTAPDWDRLRVAHAIPETGIELIPDESFILEMGFDRLHGVDFRKGCYVGQEVTARMKHKTSLRKGLARVSVEGTAQVGSPIEADGKPVGTLFTQSAGEGLAYLRFDRADGEMHADGATLRRIDVPT